MPGTEGRPNHISPDAFDARDPETWREIQSQVCYRTGPLAVLSPDPALLHLLHHHHRGGRGFHSGPAAIDGPVVCSPTDYHYPDWSGSRVLRRQSLRLTTIRGLCQRRSVAENATRCVAIRGLGLC